MSGKYKKQESGMFIWSGRFRDLLMLDSKDVGDIIKNCIHNFVDDGEEIEINELAAKMCYLNLLESIMLNKQNYEELVQKRAENGRKGGLAKKEKEEEKDIETPKVEIKKEQDLELDIESPQKKKREKKEEETFEVFNAAWELYPRKEGKNQVKKEAKKELEKEGIETIKQAINSYKKEIVGREKNFILQGSTFFNGRYKDYIIKEQPKKERENKDWSDSDLEELRKLGYDV